MGCAKSKVVLVVPPKPVPATHLSRVSTCSTDGTELESQDFEAQFDEVEKGEEVVREVLSASSPHGSVAHAVHSSSLAKTSSHACDQVCQHRKKFSS